MATAQQIIDRAGGLLRIVDAAGDAVDATTSADMLTHLQMLISDWGEDGLIEIPAPSALSTELNVSPGTERALAYNLAADYSELVGKALSARAISVAERTRGRLVAESTVSRSANLRNQGMSVSYGRYNIRNDA